MKNLVFIGVLFLFSKWTYAQEPITKGTWFNQEKESRIKFAAQGDVLNGKIVWLKNGDVLDKNNPDQAQKSKPLTGSVILKGFKPDGQNTWKNGKVYDPKSGKTYDAKINLKDNGILEIRGYVGSPMFGRTTTFTRAD